MYFQRHLDCCQASRNSVASFKVQGSIFTQGKGRQHYYSITRRVYRRQKASIFFKSNIMTSKNVAEIISSEPLNCRYISIQQDPRGTQQLPLRSTTAYLIDRLGSLRESRRHARLPRAPHQQTAQPVLEPRTAIPYQKHVSNTNTPNTTTPQP